MGSLICFSKVHLEGTSADIIFMSDLCISVKGVQPEAKVCLEEFPQKLN
jgi:hypothetical protein